MTARETLEEKHRLLYDKFVWGSDQDVFHKVDHWAFPVEVNGVLMGDCDDFALRINTQMKAAGFKPRLVLCYTELGGAHLVCECEGWVADNRRTHVISAKQLQNEGYRYIAFNDKDATEHSDWIIFTGFRE